MEILRLTTKQGTFEAISEGVLTEYAREIRPATMEKYCEVDEDGYVVDIDGVLQPRFYDVVQFKCGHDTYTCKIEGARIELFEDDDHNLITYEENGEEYIQSQVVYLLGEKIML